jgi:hypothetical protein
MKISFVIDEYGPALASDEDYDVLITVNGAYFNVWVNRGQDNWENTEAFSVDGRADLEKDKFWDIQKVAEELLEEVLSEDDEEEDDDEED